MLLTFNKMHIEPRQIYYIDCPINTPVYSRDNRLIGYTDGYKARPTGLSNGSICLSQEPIKQCTQCNDDDAEYNFPDSQSEYCYSCSEDGMINRKDFNWISGEGIYIVGMGIKLTSDFTKS